MLDLIASTAPAAEPTTALMNGIVVIGASSVVSLIIGIFTLFRMMSGKANERQIEPTQLAAIQAELKAQTATLSEIKTAGATTATHVENLRSELGNLRTAVKASEDNAFRRINAISAESTENKTRIGDVSRRVERLEDKE